MSSQENKNFKLTSKQKQAMLNRLSKKRLGCCPKATYLWRRNWKTTKK